MTQTRTPITIITGGNHGLGKNVAQKLVQRGTDVILAYRSSRAEADTLVAELVAQSRHATTLQLDTGKIITFPAFAEAVRSVLARWRAERFDYLVNNAGIDVHAMVAETTETQLDELMNVHFKGVFFLTQILLPLMADGECIVNVSSGLVYFVLSGYGAYATMKGMVEMLTCYLTGELRPHGIAVNMVTPGTIETDFDGGTVRDNASLNAVATSNTALGRARLPDDIGGMIASLLLPDNRWINAQHIEASGGVFL